MGKNSFVIYQPYFEDKLYYCPNHEWKRNIGEAITYDTLKLANKHQFRLQKFATQQLKKSGIDPTALIIESTD